MGKSLEEAYRDYDLDMILARREGKKAFRAAVRREVAESAGTLRSAVLEARAGGMRDKDIRDALNISAYQWRNLADELEITTDRPGRPRQEGAKQ